MTKAKSGSPLIVGVGASAGGLEAFQELLSGLGDSPDMAIVFVQHLDPTTKSLLQDLLANTTTMDVVELAGRKKLKANTVYVGSPQALLELKNGYVRIVQPDDDEERQSNSIDHFFHSIAEDQGERGIGIILSGAGSDGTLGLKAISDRGGLTFAQESKSAKFDSMPRSAATTGVADHVLAPKEMAAELLHYAKHLKDLGGATSHERLHEQIEEAIPAIAEALMEQTGHNFQHYKTNTLIRRTQRRMQVLKIATASDYLDHLIHHEEEAQALFRELLIGVTAFFRDPDAFAALQSHVLTKLFEKRMADDCVRIWVAGCANGAEAYTLAILCREVMDQLESSCEVQIFATDIDERALAVARAGVYPVGIEDHVSPERLKRFFIKRGKKYQVTKEIRDMVLYSPHNLISDPPFSRQDLISCRNLLIYLGPHLQNKLVPLFHYALRPSGYLFLGPSENITSHGELFRAVDAKLRISQRKGTAAGSASGMTFRPGVPLQQQERNTPDASVDLTNMMQKIALDEFTPKTTVIDASGQVLTSSPNIGKYLSLTGGPVQTNIYKMAAPGLRIGLRSAISDAKKVSRRVEHENLSVHDGDKIQRVMLTVQPMPRLGEDEPLFMVVFHDIGLPIDRDEVEAPINQESDDAATLIAQLERELETTRSDLDKTMQDMEAANEELKSSNEELLSMNEELQSANEELETSKEEIRIGSDATARANADLENLLRSTQIATIFLDDELCIRSFTPAVTAIYDLLATDIGRPLSRFVPLVDDMPPLPDPKTFREDGRPIEHAVHAQSGTSYMRRVLPYQSYTGEAEGIVVTFTDVTELTESERRLALALDATSDGSWDWNIQTGEVIYSDQWIESLGYTRDEVPADISFWEQIVHPDDMEHTREALRRHFDGETEQYSFENRMKLKSGQYRWNLDRGRVVTRDADGKPLRMVGTDTDISERKHAQLELEASQRQLQTMADAIPPLIAVVDPQQRFTYVNRAYAAHWQRPADEIIGFRIAEVVSDEAYQAIRPKMLQALSGERVTYELILKRPGTDETMYEQVDYIPQLNAEGDVEAVQVVVTDLTGQTQRELDLQESETLVRTMAENSTQAMITMDDRGYLTYCNRAFLDMVGFDEEEIRSKPLHDLIHHSHPDGSPYPMSECPIDRALPEDFTVRAHEDLFFRKDGSSFHVSCAASPIFRDGVPISTVIEVRDITEQKQWAKDITSREAYLRRLIDNQLGLVGLIDKNGILLEVDDDSMRIAGLTRDDVIGKHFAECAWWTYDDAVAEQMRETMDRAFAGETVRYDVPLFGAGLGGPEDRLWIDFQMTPVCSETGEVEYLIPSGVDISDRKRMEEDLRSSREELQLAMQVAEFAIARIDYTNDKVQLSAEAARLYGVGDEPVQIIREELHATFHPEDRDRIHGAIDLCLEKPDGSLFAEQHRVQLPGGKVRWLDVRKQVFCDTSREPAKPSHAILAARDITEQRRWQNELADREAQLRRVIDNMLTFVGILDTDGNLQEVNETAVQAGGIRRDDVIGKPFWECYWWCYDEAVGSKLREAFASCLEGNIVRYDVPVRMAEEEMMIDFMMVPVKDANGNITQIIPSGVDISERHAAEQALQESERQLRLAAAAAGFGTYHVDLLKGRVTWSTEMKRIVGMLDDADLSISPKEVPDFVHPDDRELVAREMSRAHKVDQTRDHLFTHRIVWPDGSTRWVKLQGRTIVSGDNGQMQPTQILGTLVDVTEEKEFESKLETARRAAEAANEAKSSFLANMSHEIRTPMTAIMGYADLVAEKVNDEETQAYVNTIRHNGVFLLDIINDILDLSKIEAGKFDLSIIHFAPHQLVEDVRSMMEVRAIEQGIKLSVDYRSKIPAEIASDPKRLKQVLINLIGNAIKFTPEGEVQIVVSFDSGTLRFEIIDSGIGMSPQQQAKLFQPFSQGDGNVNREFGGTGLGLAISKRLTEMLGGEITCSSELGSGSTFTVTIDAEIAKDIEQIDPENVQRESKSGISEPLPSLECHVLIVDDRRDIRFLSRKMLEKAGAEISEAEDGEIALRIVREEVAAGRMFDLILLDMQMPRLDGYGTAEQLRTLGYTGPIIALTADAMQGDMSRCLAAGCNDYLSKPIDNQKLVEMVHRFTSIQPSNESQAEAVGEIDIQQRFQDALERMGGERELLVTMAAMAVNDAPELIDQVSGQLAAGRWAEASASVHALKGTLATFESGSPITELQQLEDAARESDGSAANELWNTARPSIESLIAEIALLIDPE